MSNAAPLCLRRLPGFASVLLTIPMAIALSSSALAGEDGASVLGQSGSGGRGQSGSGGRAISVADVFGQSGSGGRGQSGSGGRAATKSGALGLVELLSSDGEGSSVVVLGQKFTLDSAAASQISVGDYVVVTVDTADTVTLQKVAESYVAGVSPVALMGIVDQVNVGTASLVVGGVSIDYSSQLALNPSLVPASGALFAVVGTQPVPSGVVLAGREYDGAVVTLSSAD